ncbi:MAG: AAA family ATPase [Oscillospiraceae bacterium]|jgi:CO dehydrogenase maturation factor|nr:AAA family ATPase [Oscillospiraceae bacterium]
MKIAVSGKGGVGKSTIAAAICLHLAAQGQEVLALDADPDANLASALGMPQHTQDKIIPISRQIDLIEERTGAKVDEYGKVFKLNPEVSDVAGKFGVPVSDHISLLVLGAIQNGGGGCACPESTFIRSLVTDLVLYKNQSLVMDMEAGVEHLGRATAGGVDIMIVVLEPGKRAVDCATLVIRMARDIGIQRLLFVGNKISGSEDEQYLRRALPDAGFVAFIPYSQRLRAADRDGVCAAGCIDGELREPFERIYRALDQMQGGSNA